MSLSLEQQVGFTPQRLIPSIQEVSVLPWDSAKATDHGIFGFDSRNINSRSFNLLRSRILKLMSANRWRTLGIVSATPGAGKSFISSNLSAALSRQPDRDVYLFDFDLRRSSIASIFDFPQGPSLNQYLAGELKSLTQVGKRIGDEKLVVFPSLSRRESSAELLSGAPMDRLMREMKTLPERTLCIADLPPVFANDDAAIVAGRLDAYLFIVEDGRTTKKQIRDSMNILAPAICAGTVLNRYYAGFISDDYGYSYGQSGAYGEYYKD